MKKIFGGLLVAFIFSGSATMAQEQAGKAANENEVEMTATANENGGTKADKKARQRQQAEMRSNGNAYSGRGENAAKPVSPYNSNASVGGFTVTKYKESKVTKKLRRGEARSRMSVPDPKGKPLVHKKKKKFIFFG